MTEFEAARVVLCEGDTDRYFLGGWLRRSGWKPIHDKGRGVRAIVDGKGVPDGVHVFGCERLPRDLVEVHKVNGGGTQFPRNLATTLRRPEVTRLLVAHDPDSTVDMQPTLRMPGWLGSIKNAPQVSAAEPTELAWSVLRNQDEDESQLPSTHCLERVVCVALRDAYPERWTSLESWLAAAPVGESSGKHFVHSHAGKWARSDRFGNQAYAALWDDERIAAALEAVLAESGAKARWDGFLSPNP
jgi:hypothetical protein